MDKGMYYPLSFLFFSKVFRASSLLLLLVFM